MLVIPPGGWHFLQPIEGGTTMRIEGQTYSQLEDRVFDFRIHNTDVIPSGSSDRIRVREDLRTQICSKFPEQCVGSWTIPERRETSRDHGTGYVAPIQRIEDWFKVISTKEIQWKDASRAYAAADACATCPQNIKWQTDCRPCSTAIEKRIMRYKGDRFTPLDHQLNACRIFGHHNSLAVWMQDTLSKPSGEEIPDHCWLKT